ncbi:hypothetical protein NPIL_532291 [Nephila pilipes]|uniref:Uncharacterized protein n=1 Tax=Nephila pilipes TaxID=299642 RepID=A0A8X6QHN2_NEPPI|nr:hypothetical protein NPIL_532291 [Nephila pilipes]
MTLRNPMLVGLVRSNLSRESRGNLWSRDRHGAPAYHGFKSCATTRPDHVSNDARKSSIVKSSQWHGMGIRSGVPTHCVRPRSLT